MDASPLLPAISREVLSILQSHHLIVQPAAATLTELARVCILVHLRFTLPQLQVTATTLANPAKLLDASASEGDVTRLRRDANRFFKPGASLLGRTLRLQGPRQRPPSRHPPHNEGSPLGPRPNVLRHLPAPQAAASAQAGALPPHGAPVTGVPSPAASKRHCPARKVRPDASDSEVDTLVTSSSPLRLQAVGTPPALLGVSVSAELPLPSRLP